MLLARQTYSKQALDVSCCSFIFSLLFKCLALQVIILFDLESSFRSSSSATDAGEGPQALLTRAYIV